MSDVPRIVLVGATGLVGQAVIAEAVGREDLRLSAIARREVPLPAGARMEVFLAETDKWSEVIEALRPLALICALGTTWRKSGKDEAAFRAVDEDLVLAVAIAAKAHGVERFVAVSSAGADATSGNFYLRVKGEVERQLAAIRFARLDILRPGLLRGHRAGERRAAERAAIALSPVADMLLHGRWRTMRSIPAARVAEAALAFALRKAAGRFVHDNDAILRAARSLARPHG
jgi:uncharacterized protein YbjT (DUF2867 family)